MKSKNGELGTIIRKKHDPTIFCKNALYQITHDIFCTLSIMNYVAVIDILQRKKFSPKTIFITGKLINNSLQKKPVCYSYIYTGSKVWFDMNQT